MTGTSSIYRVWIYLFVAIGLLLGAVLSYHFIYRFPFWTFRAVRVAGSSFCPTICEGEHVFVQMLDAKPYVPTRGDPILFEHGLDKIRFIKRVVGVAGDNVAPGPDNTILVNGKAWVPPPACAKLRSPAAADRDISSAIVFPPTQVPAGELFVIGDNLNFSFDSRSEGFGFVPTKLVVGKPVMIYWSKDTSRIGCSIE